MEMTVASFFNDFYFMGVFLLIGFILREVIKPLQKLFIPTAVIGGLVALIVGPQILNVVPIPEESFSGMSTMIAIIMTSLVFGTKIDKTRVKSYLDYTLVIVMVYGMQLGVGLLLGKFLGKFWVNLPEGWGMMGVVSFWNGHSVAAPAGLAFEELGVSGNYDMGMILSTIGIIVAISVGMILVNYGVRKGYAKNLNLDTVDGKLNISSLSGAIDVDKRVALGEETVSSVSVNSLALHFAYIATSIYFGGHILNFLKNIFPAFASIPSFVGGMLGALIMWKIMTSLKLDKYVDKKTIQTISGFALEFLIFGAVATISVELVTQFFIPIIIYSAVIVLLIIAIFFRLGKYFKQDFFEKMLIGFGQTTGNSSAGLAVLRCVDPEMKSTAAEACAIGTTLWAPVYSLLPAFGPALALSNIWALAGIGFAIMLVSYILLRFVLWK